MVYFVLILHVKDRNSFTYWSDNKFMVVLKNRGVNMIPLEVGRHYS